ncbi:MAG: hypothetical protein V3S63_06645 [bacterium]
MEVKLLPLYGFALATAAAMPILLEYGRRAASGILPSDTSKGRGAKYSRCCRK